MRLNNRLIISLVLFMLNPSFSFAQILECTHEGIDFILDAGSKQVQLRLQEPTLPFSRATTPNPSLNVPPLTFITQQQQSYRRVLPESFGRPEILELYHAWQIELKLQLSPANANDDIVLRNPPTFVQLTTEAILPSDCDPDPIDRTIFRLHIQSDNQYHGTAICRRPDTAMPATEIFWPNFRYWLAAQTLPR